ncbi:MULTISPECIES: pyridoxal phosphate-dependent aminotransferase [Atopobiaceae]|uniref:Aminotransferase n=1 Tax=Parafannyhessea umbonata TaxID=604330 RepID=A0A1H9Q6X2_9ACTN|nr:MULTISPECIES: pyridoxal phosphate-dependent aminotransferase [Atopobiaceae]SEH65434.1 aspartate aminotransferase [Parafannyhessea umbonata]SER56316.1 aspartate aminotransferase [Parafannyhessea umbonata]SJZ65041.1 aspartate aminotransferase [Olsenella sp. KH1P3]
MSINEKSYAFGAAKSSIREIAAYGAARKAEIGAENVFDFSIGNPSVPAPESVRAAIERCAQLPPTELHGYTPAAGLPQARKAVADSLNRRFSTSYGLEDLYLTCGAAASISITLHALVNPGDEVIVIAPYFPEYRVWIETAGATCVEVMADPETFQIDTAAVAAAITPATKAIIVDSPNNPVGSVYSAQNLADLAQVLTTRGEEIGHPIYLVSDEPYREITYGVEVPWVPAAYERTIVCYSYSKSLSLPGERIGWVLVPNTNPDHDELMFAVAGAGRKLGFVCAPALFQRVLAECVDEPTDIDAYARNREALTRGLSELGYEYIEPQGAFYLWVKALEPDAEAFFRKAKAFEILPVPSDSFGCGGWVRLGYCVSYDTIVNSMPAWKKLMEQYR